MSAPATKLPFLPEMSTAPTIAVSFSMRSMCAVNSSITAGENLLTDSPGRSKVRMAIPSTTSRVTAG